LYHFKNHQKNHHIKNASLPYVYVEGVKLNFKQEKTHSCDQPGCFYTTSQKGNLVRHKMIHTGVKRFSCDVTGCSYKCIQKIQLIKHQLSNHKKEIPKQPQQPICDQEGSINLKGHKRKDHSDDFGDTVEENIQKDEPYNLRKSHQIDHKEDDHLLTKTKPKLKIHNNRRIRSRLNQYLCNHQGCNRRFITLKGLEKHKSRSHPKITSKGKRFALKSQLETHHLDEQDNVPIPTTIINNFADKKRSGVNGDKSIENKPKNPYGLRKRQRINKINKLNDDDDDCICKFTGCRKAFDSLLSLKIHQQQFHMITKTYACSKTGCNFRTKFFIKLEKHQTEKHRI